MTSSRRNARNRATGSLALLFAAVVLIVSSISRDAAAQAIEQYQRHAMIGGRLSSSIFILGLPGDAAAVRSLFDNVISKANAVYAALDWQNPSSDVSRLNAQAGQGKVQVQPETLAAFKTARSISEWSGGAFDVAYAGAGNYKDISIDTGAQAVELKTPGMQVRFDGIVEGFIADIMFLYLSGSNVQNAMVKVGSAFRGAGQNQFGPWKVQIEDESGIFARHALNLTVNNTGVAAVSADVFRYRPIVDPRSKSQSPVTCKGVVAIMKEAAPAQGIANAVFVLGPDDGQKLLQKMAKGLIVSNTGQFIRTPGF